MNLNAPPNVKWWTIENAEGVPLASDAPLGQDDAPEPETRPAGRCKAVLIFSRREFAQQVLERAELAGAKIVLYSGRYEAAAFLEKVGKLGAIAMVVDSGQPTAHWFAIHAESWKPIAVNRARARQIGLVV